MLTRLPGHEDDDFWREMCDHPIQGLRGNLKVDCLNADAATSDFGWPLEEVVEGTVVDRRITRRELKTCGVEFSGHLTEDAVRLQPIIGIPSFPDNSIRRDPSKLFGAQDILRSLIPFSGVQVGRSGRRLIMTFAEDQNAPVRFVAIGLPNEGLQTGEAEEMVWLGHWLLRDSGFLHEQCVNAEGALALSPAIGWIVFSPVL